MDHEIGPVFTHGAVETTNEAFRSHGINLKPSTLVRRQGEGAQDKKAYRGVDHRSPRGARVYVDAQLSALLTGDCFWMDEHAWCPTAESRR